MSTVKLQFPQTLGAVNVHVTDSKGLVVADQQLLTPRNTERIFTVDKPGQYTAHWQPVDGDVEAYTFTLGEDNSEITIPVIDQGDLVREIVGTPLVRRVTPVKKAKARRKAAPPIAYRGAKRSIIDDTAGATPIWESLGSAVQSFVERQSSQPARPSMLVSPYLNIRDTEARSNPSGPAFTSIAAVTPHADPSVIVGIASDSTPLRRGGWRPYFGNWPVRLHSGDGLTFVIQRDETSLIDPQGHDGARIRFSVGVKNRPLTRFLAPLFAGGVAVNIKRAGALSDDLTYSILPTNPRTRALMQALVLTSADEARQITTEMEATAEHLLGQVASDNFGDPWIAVALGFIAKRYDWSEDCSWCLRLAEKFEWIVDTLVLAGWWKSTPAGGCDYATCLDYLAKASARGAPYFADAGATSSDLLVWMASDLPDAGLRERARQELVKSRQIIQFRGRAGASLAWFATKARITAATDLVLYQGHVSEGFTSAQRG